VARTFVDAWNADQNNKPRGGDESLEEEMTIIEWYEAGTLQMATLIPGCTSHRAVFNTEHGRAIEMHIPNQQMEILAPALLKNDGRLRLKMILETHPESDE
jgi:hypothetical protein